MSFTAGTKLGQYEVVESVVLAIVAVTRHIMASRERLTEVLR